jgi:CheY-like chemotaxis protein
MAKKVLIIDDDTDFREAIATVLDAKGFQVIHAEDGKDGFAKAKSESPDIVLLDVMMTTKTEGFDVARSLVDDDKTKNIPVVLITGIRRDMNLAFGFESNQNWLPVKAVLEKPIKPELLLKTVEEHIKK